MDLKRIRIRDLLYVFLIFDYIVVSSTWSLIDKVPAILNSTNVMLSVGVLSLMLSVIQNGIVGRQLLWYIGGFAVILGYLMGDGNKGLALVVLLSLAFLRDSFRRQMRLYYTTAIISVALVVVLSLVGFLPKSGTLFLSGSWQGVVLGFRNPNALGYILTSLFLVGLYLENDIKHKRLFWIFQIVVVIYTAKGLLYDTGTAGQAIGLVIYSMQRTRFNKVFKNMMVRGFISIVPFLFLAVQILVAVEYNSSQWLINHDDIFHSRFSIWSYYWENYNLKWFGNVFEVVRSGFNITVGQGAFDGMYIYLLLAWGIVGVGLASIFLMLSLFNKNYAEHRLWILLLPVVIMGGFENGFLSVGSSPLLLLMANLVYQRKIKKEFI